MNRNWKIYRIDTDTGEALFVRLYENTSEAVMKQKVSSFNRLASKSPAATMWVYCYVAS